MANPDDKFGISPYEAQKVLTTSIDDCAAYCSQPTNRTLYLSLGTNVNGQSMCTCGNTLNAMLYRASGVDFLCDTPCNFTNPPPSNDYCGGQFGQDPLVVIFGAV